MPRREDKNEEEGEEEKNWNMFFVSGREKGEGIVDEAYLRSLAFADIAAYIVDLQLYWIRRSLWTTDARQGSQLVL
jgi:hypothetical protein